MSYRPIKLTFIAFILAILVTPWPVILAAPAYQTTPTATLTPILTSTLQISPIECYQIYTVQPTETLSKLAQRFYGAAVYFTAIIEATNIKSLTDSTFEPIADNNRLKVGQKLCIINTTGLPVIPRSEADLIIQATLITATQVKFPTQSAILNQPIAPTLKIGTQVIEVPTDKAALTAENLSPVEVVFDLIGPSGQSYLIAPSQKWPIILEPGRYSFNIHAATGRTEDIAVAPGAFEIRAQQLAELVIFARSIQLNLRDMAVPASSTAANFNPAPLNTATPSLIPTSSRTVIPATVARPATTPTVVNGMPTNIPVKTVIPTVTGVIPGPVTPVIETPSTNTPQPRATSTPTFSAQATLTTTSNATTATPQPTATPTIATATNTSTPQPTSTPTVAPSTTATPQPTSTVTPTIAPTPTTAARPTDNSPDSKEKLAPPLGQGRLYFQNFYRETANIELNNQTIAVDVEMIKMVDLPPKTYSFRVTVAKGAGQGEIDLAANYSWLVRLDPNGGLGWVQVYP